MSISHTGLAEALGVDPAQSGHQLLALASAQRRRHDAFRNALAAPLVEVHKTWAAVRVRDQVKAKDGNTWTVLSIHDGKKPGTLKIGFGRWIEYADGSDEFIPKSWTFDEGAEVIAFEHAPIALAKDELGPEWKARYAEVGE